MDDNHTCLAGCGKRITWRFAICADCEKIYSNRMSQWPEWLKFLWRDTLRERRRQANRDKHETDFQQLELFDLDA